MLFKKKSIIVGIVSSIVIALVLILTLIGYFAYLEFKADEFRRYYQELLGKAKARVYAKYIDIPKIDTRIENTGPLKGKAIVEGTVVNKGSKNVTDLVIKINFLDKDDAVIYELLVHPQEPAIGNSALAQMAIPYLYSPPKTVLKPNEHFNFKKMISNCPTEIFVELREGQAPPNTSGKSSNHLIAQAVSLDF